MAKVLVCGSVSYDIITLFPEKFRNHLIPNQDEFLNATFHVKDMRREFGGCAMNICYNLKLLGYTAFPVATVGDDFEHYAERMKQTGIPLDYIMSVANTRTAHYFITVDAEENQIVVFYPGAMESSYKNKIKYEQDITLGVIAPDAVKGMLQHALYFAENNIPFIFDPGPVIHLLEEEDIQNLISLSKWIILNGHEWDILNKKTGLSKKDIVSSVEACIITEGGNGSSIITNSGNITVPAVPVKAIDPTGCGDAYRSGIIYGILNRLDWKTTGQIATLMGAVCAEQNGAQNHQFIFNKFRIRYKENFGLELKQDFTTDFFISR